MSVGECQGVSRSVEEEGKGVIRSARCSSCCAVRSAASHRHATSLRAPATSHPSALPLVHRKQFPGLLSFYGST